MATVSSLKLVDVLTVPVTVAHQHLVLKTLHGGMLSFRLTTSNIVLDRMAVASGLCQRCDADSGETYASRSAP